MIKARKPAWLKIKVLNGKDILFVEKTLLDLNLNSVCSAAKCPNRAECFDNRTATFMILGTKCTRGCRFCNILKDKPEEINLDEPKNIAKAVDLLKLKYVVITSVTRDDLVDGGAGHFYNVSKVIKDINPETSIELLIPDFKGEKSAIDKVLNSGASVINHNIETVEGLYPNIRIGADYQRSLNILKYIKDNNTNIVTKSGLILGMGEKEGDVITLLKDLRSVRCDLLTIGQYLPPSSNHLSVKKYITPLEFENWKQIALDMGFLGVSSGPFVRSSYNALDLTKQIEDGRCTI
ncbi:lipoyl synthase [Thiospirochaeta perfilievii]|uniref:lipoyl synthase n=1 Tax=Thiospirochaeta perfilievii TaxID=252967 RepID=UPI001CA8AF2C|nr:lipoyl synthase [Thiospirochaeta perfilievii]